MYTYPRPPPPPQKSEKSIYTFTNVIFYINNQSVNFDKNLTGPIFQEWPWRTLASLTVLAEEVNPGHLFPEIIF